MKVLFLDKAHSILEQRLTDAGYTCIDGSELSDSECISLALDVVGIPSEKAYFILKSSTWRTARSCAIGAG